MIAKVRGGRLCGVVRAVPSKACAHRLLVASALADAPTAVFPRAEGRDVEATVRCLKALGAKITERNEGWLVTPARPARGGRLDCGESAATLRFLMPVAAALGVGAEMTGTGRLPDRPHGPLCGALRAHGVSIDSDRPPLRVCGRPSGGDYRLPGDVSSQYVSGLLFALPLLAEDSRIVLTTPAVSESYAKLTAAVLARFGVAVRRTEEGWLVPGGQVYRSPERARVEGDWSAAAFWLAANAAGSRVTVDGLDVDSPQGDRAAPAVLEAVRGGGAVVDAADIPDLVPAVAALAAVTPGRTRVVRAGRLRAKESDRLAALACGLNAMGARVRETEDGLDIEGGPLRGARVSGRGDHRVVMALAVAALNAEGQTEIEGAEAVGKSYPGFWEDYRALGGHVRVEYAGQ